MPRPRPRELLAALVQGPAEMLPVSSSAHARLLGARDKRAEVAVHAGSALALVRPVRPWFAAVTVAPAAVAVLLAQRVVEEKLSAPLPTAAGLVAGSVALLGAELADAGAAEGPGARRGGGAGRGAREATLADALALGAAQATALWPGVSRSAATLAVARLRGFSHGAALDLSQEAALPVLVAAALRKPPHRVDLPAVAVAAASTAIARRVVPPPQRLWPFALYRLALAIGIVWQDRRR